jgi:hypothetical protein
MKQVELIEFDLPAQTDLFEQAEFDLAAQVGLD